MHTRHTPNEIFLWEVPTLLVFANFPRISARITVLLTFLIALTFVSPAYAEPPYAKWGRMAMQQTKQHYPQAQIVDYLHVGRIKKTPTTSEETFKLLLQEGNRKRALFVHIEFDNNTEKVVRITFDERA
ncbi:hypothetical protein BRE01_51600 [Brevibacillus reuszeri]|uniref:DUF3889 domain-containing protein n=1 Tax=Brevibacillus reuszeri TaxID=54915 RepID=A0ABQ0TU91_9BACL|nr:hypothetical protein BRE01_51600 [Brevibacillus reuszeri]